MEQHWANASACGFVNCPSSLGEGEAMNVSLLKGFLFASRVLLLARGESSIEALLRNGQRREDEENDPIFP